MASRMRSFREETNDSYQQKSSVQTRSTMARKKALASVIPSTTTRDSAPDVVPSSEIETYEAVKVNNANLTELKIALDDAVRRVSRPLDKQYLLSDPFRLVYPVLLPSGPIQDTAHSHRRA